MLGDAQAVIDGGVVGGGIKPRRRAKLRGRHLGHGLERFRRIARLGDERGPAREGFRIAALGDEVLVDKPFRHTTWASALMTATFVPGLSCR